MITTRRYLIKSSIFAGSGILLSPLVTCRNISGSFLDKIGICTNLSNWKILEAAGYSYLEETVQNFLVPLEDESVFNKNLEQLNLAVPDGFSREEALEQFTDLCCKMAPVAEKYDVIIDLEPLNKGECNLLNLVADGGKIVRNVNHKNFRPLRL